MIRTTERFVATNGVRLRVTEAGERGNPVVLLAHGFPELAYSWRHQIPALAAAGYHVLAPDQRGYGGSSRPDDVAAYNIVELTSDLAGLLEDVGARRAVLVGHDWGSPVVCNFALLHPDRVDGIVAMSVPPVPRPPAPPTELWRRAFGDNYFYILHFQEPGVADAELGADPAATMHRVFADVDSALGPPETRRSEPSPLPAWITQAELDHYVAEFTRTGFTGGLNWYRNFDRNWELTAHTPAATIDVPTLFLAGAADPVLLFTPRDRVRDVVTGPYRELLLDGAGHWVQQERPAEVNEALLAFLAEIHR
ncbi:alpha/beta hydrolase [uncultured Mycolicibacterium sp.]|uniref:alpha/beta fold hydrolase n=1 Tax=uncultured Mycolicibacterium sp. TaxID=2320817 RepID=UPI002607BFF0|nr:alpha/beta hydrolase [uncultured Mycolicibacterium sp.]